MPNSFEVVPQIWEDDRGSFLEWYRWEAVSEAVGHPLNLAQANCSTSRRGSLRGLHFAEVAPGQAKYVTCVGGAVLDVVVDIRVGSPTFGSWDSVRLDTRNRSAVYVAEGLAHGFLALTEEATVVYLCNQVYAPGREHAVHPLDPALAIDWPSEPAALLSAKDAAAPSLAQAQALGLLPDYAACLALYRDAAERVSR